MPIGEPMSEEEQKKQEEATQKLIHALSQVNSILDLPPEIVIQILKIKQNDVWRLSEVIRLAETMEFTPEEMSHVLDLARVSRIMEEDDPWVLGPTGPTGPTGAYGPTGPVGMNGPSGPSKMHPRFPLNTGPIKGSQFSRR
jgi:hypothetical protein